MDAKKIVTLQGHLETHRSNFDNLWNDVAEYVAPRNRNFTSLRTEGDRVNQKIFDSTAITANNRFASSLGSLMTPSNQRWHGLTINSMKDKLSNPIKQYFDELTDMLFALRYRPDAGFESANGEVRLDLGAFGNGILYIGNELGKGPVYVSCGLEGMYWLTDNYRRINLVHRKYKLRTRQIIEEFGEENLPEMVMRDLKKDGMKEWEIIHAVHPNTEIEQGRADYKGMKFLSTYVLKAGNHVLSEGGYRTLPYSIGRYFVASQETYGRSVAMECFPDIKTLNSMSKTNLKASHLMVAPPMLSTEDGVLGGLKMFPEAINYGGIDSRGQQAVQPLMTGVNIPVSLEVENQRRESINNSFLVSLFQILVDSPTMTATEVMQRAQEKGVLLGPTFSRMQAEFFGPMIEREIDILDQMGVLPEMPQELIDMGGLFDIDYQSPLARAARAEDGIAILRTVEAISPLAEIDPTVMQILKVDDTVRELADIYGVPARLLRSEDEMEEIRSADEQAQEQQNMLQMAQVASSASKDLAQAQQAEVMAPDPILMGS